MKSLYRSLLRRAVSPRLLNRANALSHLEDRLVELERRCARLAELALQKQYPALGSGATETAEFAVYSQNGEDGLLLSILAETGAPAKRFVEIGFENARECNTAVLGFLLGWDGLMLDADGLGVESAKRLAARLLEGKTNRVAIRRSLVTAESINGLIEEEGFSGELDVLSIDVDGMDYWLWKALRTARPRVVVIEYNASLGSEEALTVPYNPRFECRRAHPSGFYHGASLAAMERLGLELGYSLVAVESHGVNAFFVREDLRPAGVPARNARELFRPHFERSKATSQEAQWAAIQHLPWLPV